MIEWFRHDTDARNDIKIRKLLRDCEPGALGAYWMCVEMIYQAGGYAEESAIAEELSFYSMDKFIPALVEHGLLEEVGNGILTSQRVIAEIKWQEERRQKKVEAGRMGGLAKASNAKAMPSNAKATPSDALAQPSTIQDTTIHNKDCNVSKDYQEEHLSIKNKSLTDKTDIACSEPLNELMLEAENPTEKPVFITIVSRTGSEVPVYKEMVEMWKEAYPAVDVEAQLREMKAWSKSNPTERKSERGMNRFINNWLSKEQDKAGRFQGSSQPPKHKDYSIVGKQDASNFSWMGGKK